MWFSSKNPFFSSKLESTTNSFQRLQNGFVDVFFSGTVTNIIENVKASSNRGDTAAADMV